MAGIIRVGTQGWNYTDWVGGFFPDETRPTNFLGTYARAFTTVEIDSTFYAVPAESALRGWAARTPPGFIFSLKFPKEVTHEGQLRDSAGITEQFFDRVRILGPKLGPILVQLEPSLGPERLDALLDFLPRVPRDLQVAIEFRNRGWITPSVLDLLTEHSISLALVDGPWIPRRWMLKLAERPTGRFTYIRWMGPDRLLTDHSHVQIDRSRELELWEPAIHVAAEHGDVFAYSSNYYEGHAPATIRTVQELLGQPTVDPATLGEQIRLL